MTKASIVAIPMNPISNTKYQVAAMTIKIFDNQFANLLSNNDSSATGMPGIIAVKGTTAPNMRNTYGKA